MYTNTKQTVYTLQLQYEKNEGIAYEKMDHIFLYSYIVITGKRL